MQTLFWIAWVFDLIVLSVCLYETFAVSSNSSWAIPCLILSVLVIAAWWFRNSNPKLALALAGIPAGLVAAFILIWLLMIITKTDWK